MDDPGVALLGAVLRIETSAVGVIGVATVLVLLPGSGSLTPGGKPIVAVFEMVPVAFAATTPVMVISRLAPEASVGMDPEIVLPDTETAAGQLAPALALPQVALTPLMTEGTISLKVVKLALDGPALLILNR
jgi:hypothetical protein